MAPGIRARTGALLLLAAFLPLAAPAQTPSRKVEGEVSGNAFFGNTRQVLFSFRGEHERLDSAFAFRFVSRFNYGQATTEETGTVVSKRSWNTGANYDWRPYSDFAPFIRLSVESSFENRIDRRYTGGTGTRMNLVRNDATDAVFSIGVNAERTEPLAPGDSLGAKVLARGFSGLRLRRDFSPRVAATSETSYEPALTTGGDYTIQSVTALKLKINSIAGLTFMVRDHYDSKSVERGARTNNDVEVLVGLLTTF